MGGPGSGRPARLRPSERRTHLVRVFLSPAELRRLERLSRAAGVTPQEVIRMLLNEGGGR